VNKDVEILLTKLREGRRKISFMKAWVERLKEKEAKKKIKQFNIKKYLQTLETVKNVQSGVKESKNER
jgi:putative component of toxin-antitoxin plasmid stabilization module